MAPQGKLAAYMVPGTRRCLHVAGLKRLQPNVCSHTLALGGEGVHRRGPFARPNLRRCMSIPRTLRQPLPVLVWRTCPLLVTPREHRIDLVLLLVRHLYHGMG